MSNFWLKNSKFAQRLGFRYQTQTTLILKSPLFFRRCDLNPKSWIIQCGSISAARRSVRIL